MYMSHDDFMLSMTVELKSNVGQKEDKILYNLTTKVSFTRIQINTESSQNSSYFTANNT